jgi:hypothetical protein
MSRDLNTIVVDCMDDIHDALWDWRVPGATEEPGTVHTLTRTYVVGDHLVEATISLLVVPDDERS